MTPNAYQPQPKSSSVLCADCARKRFCRRYDYACHAALELEQHRAPPTQNPPKLALAFCEDRDLDTPFLDEYYTRFINDCLGLIRRGRVAFVFKPEHLLDIFALEPNIDVRVQDDIYLVRRSDNT